MNAVERDTKEWSVRAVMATVGTERRCMGILWKFTIRRATEEGDHPPRRPLFRMAATLTFVIVTALVIGHEVEIDLVIAGRTALGTATVIVTVIAKEAMIVTEIIEKIETGAVISECFEEIALENRGTI